MFKENNHYDGSACGTCRLCCKNLGDGLRLSNLDNPGMFENVKEMADPDSVLGNTKKVIRCKSNGDCYYLNKTTGCKIHGIHPKSCQGFDCMLLMFVPRMWDRVQYGVFKKGLSRISPRIMTNAQKKEAETYFVAIKQGRAYANPHWFADFYTRCIGETHAKAVMNMAAHMVLNDDDMGELTKVLEKIKVTL